jgi:V-type H+-transporting ATPase subunit a
MFGDIGHSFIYLLAAMALIVLYPKLSRGAAGNEMVGSVLSFRYFLLFMSLCGIYCGFVYNEVFGLPMNLFGSSWECAVPHEEPCHLWNKTVAKVYPFGLDPIWMFKDNELIFTNSLKMKLSVVMGVTQMVFGMLLQLIKQVRRKAWIELFLGWLPQMMYLCSFFVYMVILIIVKWNTEVDPDKIERANLIQTLINMLLKPGKLDESETYKLFGNQKGAQIAVALIFVLSIPLMLIVKPIVEMCVHGVGNGILECFVITLIDVIEFTLSALSHTASYLRLWALSLAHSQLSHVLWEQVFVMTLELNFFALFIGFAGWVVGSLVILLGMECFSSLLHAIRLMWVEFSSKFYSGTGYEFVPLSFQKEVEKL